MERTFVGWVPTALGRLSFTSIGDQHDRNCQVFNFAGPGGDGLIFGVLRRRERTSTSGMMPGNRLDFAIFLDVAKAKLPFQGEDGTLGCPKFFEVDDGSLTGEVFLARRWEYFGGRDALAALDFVRDRTAEAQSKRATRTSIQVGRDQARRRVKIAWRAMRIAVDAGKEPIDYGRAKVVLLRTGECRLTIRPDQISLWRLLRDIGTFQTLSQHDASAIEASILEEAAADIFLAVRDLAHKHYHHDAVDAIRSPVTEVTGQGDREWRKRTLEGLMRMCISYRRRDNSGAYRQALGVLAYADAFQRHLCSWFVNRGVPTRAKPVLTYDFGALKSSIEASLKARELKDSNLRARMFFAFGTVVTALTVILPSYRDKMKSEADVASEIAAADTTLRQTLADQQEAAADQLNFGQHLFLDVLHWIVDHPVRSLLLAAAIGFFTDVVIVWLVNGRFKYSWRAISTPKVNALLAFIRRQKVGSATAQALVIGILLVLAASTSIIWLHVIDEIRDPIVAILTSETQPRLVPAAS